MFGKTSILLGAALLATNAGWYVAYDLKSDALVAEKVGRMDDRQVYEKAQLEAQVISEQNARKVEQENAKKAEEADLAYDALLRKYNASLVRYEAAQRQTTSVSLSGSSSTTNGDYSASEHTNISITVKDASICAENTARLVTIHEWAKTLQK